VLLIVLILLRWRARRVRLLRRHRHAGHAGVAHRAVRRQLAGVPALHQHELEEHDGEKEPERAVEAAHGGMIHPPADVVTLIKPDVQV
jgi:hypothetical protein